MTTWIGFLRAINLGAKRKFPAADVRRVVADVGGEQVATHLNTGNVRFDLDEQNAAAVAARLESAFGDDRGFEVPTMVFAPGELRSILADAEQLATGWKSPGVHYVSLLPSAPGAEAVAALESLTAPGERLYVRGRAAHLLLDERDSYHRAKLSNATVEKHLGAATSRNLNVVRAVVEKWC